MRRAGSPRRLPRALLALALCLGLAGTGCSVSALAFVVDHRLHFVSPRSRATVTLPVTVRWTIRDFTIAGPGAGPASSHVGYFALFVDRAPVRPGQTLRAVASGDRVCLHTPGCPDQTYLNDRGVYTTTNTWFTFSQIATLNTVNSHEKKELHEVTIVLMNTAGHRIGESAWYLDFWMRKRSLL